MVQFNLLPDVKLKYVRARRTKYILTFTSIVIGSVAIGVLLISLFVVDVVQKKSLSDLDADIKTYSTELQGIDKLSTILTVQNQLSTLTQLHDAKPVTSRLFGYISKVTPAQAKLNKLTLNYTDSSLVIGGSASTLDTVSLYTDTLKATGYYTDGSRPKSTGSDMCPNVAGDQADVPEGKMVDADGSCIAMPKAFSNVVLSNFGRNDTGATFTITLNFSPDIFDALKKVQINVPSSAAADKSGDFKVGA